MRLLFFFCTSFVCCLLFSMTDQQQNKELDVSKLASVHIFRSETDDHSLITLSYNNPLGATDLKDFWKRFLFHLLLQDRVEHGLISQGIEHKYHQRGVMDQQNATVISISCPPSQAVEALMEIYHQIDEIKTLGFVENELQKAKAKAHFGLYKLQSDDALEFTSRVSNHAQVERGQHNINALIESSRALIDLVSLEELINYSQDQMVSADPTLDLLLQGESPFISEHELIPIQEEQKEDQVCEVSPTLLINEVQMNSNHPLLTQETIQEFVPQFEEAPALSDGPVVAPSLESVPAVDFYAGLPISGDEKRMIAKIVTTMAENNVFKLLYEKKKLERIGKKINHIHPMKFLGTILVDPRLVHNMHEIKKSSFKWEGFMDGLIHRMREEASRDNIKKYISGFSRSLGADVNRVTEYFDRGDYDGLVRFLLR